MLQPSLPSTYYTVEPNSAEGKVRNRLTSCKSFSRRASDLVTDLLAILDPSVAKSSAHHPTAVNEEENHEQAEDGEDDFFNQAGSSDDDQVDDDGWESGSIHSGDDCPSNKLRPASVDAESEAGLASGADSLGRKAQLESESVSGDSDNESTSGASPSSLAQRKLSIPSGGAGTSTFLPSLSVAYIPGTGDSDPEDELEAVECKGERKNRRGQRARRA